MYNLNIDGILEMLNLSTTQHNTRQCNTTDHNATQRNKLNRYNTTATQRIATQHNKTDTTQRIAAQRIATQRNATQQKGLQHNARRHKRTHLNTMKQKIKTRHICQTNQSRQRRARPKTLQTKTVKYRCRYSFQTVM